MRGIPRVCATLEGKLGRMTFSERMSTNRVVSRVCVLHIVGQERNWNYSSFTFLEWPPPFSFSSEREGKKKERIQPQSSSLSPNGQDFLHGVKSHGGWLIWKAMTHSLQEKAEFRLDLQSANKSSASVELALPRKQTFLNSPRNLIHQCGKLV